MEDRMGVILSLAEKISEYFKDHTVISLLTEKLESHKKLVIKDTSLNDYAPLIVLDENPDEIVKLINNALVESKLQSINPITIGKKLGGEEIIIMVGPNTVCVVVKTIFPCDALAKSMICRQMYSVKSFFDVHDRETFVMQPNFYNQLVEKEFTGGSIKKVNNEYKDSNKIRKYIINRLKKYITDNQDLLNGIIFLDDDDSKAINIIFISDKFKMAVMDYIRLLIEAEFKKDYTFKTFLHAEFVIPYDFRIKKFSILINNVFTKKPIYLVNMFNSGMYEVIPRIGIYAHPLVVLRFLYIEKWFLLKKNISSTQLDNQIQDQLQIIKTSTKIPNWFGFYQDENYAKTKVSMPEWTQILI